MGYWECPRCGSNDAFEGTELVGGHSQGRTVGISNEHGGFIQRHEGGELQHKEVSVIKCRDCGEILADKDYFWTEEELAEARAEVEQELKEEKEDLKNGWGCLAIGILIIAVVVYLLDKFG